MMEKDISLKSNYRKAGVTILISDKVNMNAKKYDYRQKGIFYDDNKISQKDNTYKHIQT